MTKRSGSRRPARSPAFCSTRSITWMASSLSTASRTSRRFSMSPMKPRTKSWRNSSGAALDRRQDTGALGGDDAVDGVERRLDFVVLVEDDVVELRRPPQLTQRRTEPLHEDLRVLRLAVA